MAVLIAGAGIGGLALGLSLHGLGIPFRIFEAQQAVRPFGGGINLQPPAVRELYEMGLRPELDAAGLRTEEIAYFSAQGGLIWSEPRGMFAGYDWPQYSIPRGRLQAILRDALIARAGSGAISYGTAVLGWKENAEGIAATLGDAGGNAGGEAQGRVLVAADGIDSTARARLYPGEGAAHRSGVRMWRGTTRGPKFLTGRSMAVAGRKGHKFVAYPIEDHGHGACLINWAAELAMPQGHERTGHEQTGRDWSRPGAAGDFAPGFAGWSFDWLDVPRVIAAAEQVHEYPMADRDPLPAWTHGKLTLLGDAAHAMYPVGSNGASQAILDARVLARELRDRGQGRAALEAYDDARREPVNALLLANRDEGPDRILETVATRAPEGFGDISEVMSRAELEEIAAGYRKLAGAEVAALNERGPLIPR